MGKRTLFTIVTPLPAIIPRQLAVDMLQNHVEMIQLNPLVVEHREILPPPEVSPDEVCGDWYQLVDLVPLIPGIGVSSRRISYRVVFTDTSDGVQTHVHAPLGLDIRDTWQISRDGPPAKTVDGRKAGDTRPHVGLWLREDVDMQCNRFMAPFVKNTMKVAHAVLIERLVKKAELIEFGSIQTTKMNGRLRTVNSA